MTLLAQALFGATVQFRSKQKKRNSLEEIRLVLPQRYMLKPFATALKEVGNDAKEQQRGKGIFNKIVSSKVLKKCGCYPFDLGRPTSFCV